MNYTKIISLLFCIALIAVKAEDYTNLFSTVKGEANENSVPV